MFDIDLGNNINRNFYDMRIRNNLTPFLDRLREIMRKRIENTKPEKYKDRDKDKK